MDGIEFLALVRGIAEGRHDHELSGIVQACKDRRTELDRMRREAAEGRQGKLLGLPGSPAGVLPDTRD